ncbi:MAG: OmpA family protein [Gammaproteobacteria bacterium]|nr:OmpA family protein [Gammaproteobacteria bacterium]MBU1653921.1 OmpA family protein [Gammaproteobacteria bacterium]MBU1960918.1 OmpA family protein [Gammaproteobacteria bacterium]
MMKWLIPLIGIVLIPFFVAWEKSHFDNNLYPQLQSDVLDSLEDPRFGRVTMSLDRLDASLGGQVDDLDTREAARASVDALPGVRALERNNHIKVFPRMELSRRGDKLQSSGLLSPEDRGMVGQWSLSGLDAAGLTDNALVAGLTEKQRGFLSGLADEFFALPGDRSLLMDKEGIRLSGDVTLPLLIGWEKVSEGWFDHKASLANLKLYPSLFHFPGYRKQTLVDQGLAQALGERLLAAPIYFSLGSAEIEAAENEKVLQLAEVINQSDPSARFIVGGHTDASGTLDANMVLGGARSRNLVNALVAAGVAAGRLEVVSFGPSQLAGDNETEEGRRRSRRVEILIK